MYQRSEIFEKTIYILFYIGGNRCLQPIDNFSDNESGYKTVHQY